MMAYEADVYHISDIDRITILPRNLKITDYKRLGYKILKFFMYFAPNESPSLNKKKLDIIQKIGDECSKHEIQFLLEPLVYDPKIEQGTKEYALLKPELVRFSNEIFSDPKFKVDVLKVEIPVDLSFIEGFGESIISRKDAIKHFQTAANAVGQVPFVYLSAGVSYEWFRASLIMAKDANINFSGFVCGRAIWSEAIDVFGKKGKKSLIEWLNDIGKKRLAELISIVE